jgi:hypothetical protein
VKVDLDTLAPEERRIVLVATDETYARLTESIDWKQIAKVAGFAMLGALLPPVALLPYASAVIGRAIAGTQYLTPTLARAVREGREVRSARFKVGELPIPHVAPVEAARRFRFDHGMPEDGSAYVLNPVRVDHYVRPALINERMAAEKLAAFMRLCGALGAEEIAVTSGETLDVEGRLAAAAPLPDAAGQLGLHAQFRNAREVERGVVARFDRSGAAPFVPDDVRPWLAIDPLLEAMANGRLQHGLREQACTLSFRDVVDIGAEACLALEGKGIDVGGRYRALTSSRWSFVVKFYAAG